MPGGPHPPLSVVLQWAQIANPEHPSEVRGWGLVIVNVVLYSLALFTVVARLWARVVLQHNAGIDDLIMVIAMFPITALAISTCLASRLYGFDRHAWDLTPEMAVNSRKVTTIMLITYIAGTGLIKISILLFYRRISDGSMSKTFRRIVQASIVFIMVYLLTASIAFFQTCRPFSAYWNSVDLAWVLAHPEGKDWTCYNEGLMDIVVSTISIIQDCLACGLPMMLFWKLQLPTRQKVALGAIFGVGFFLCVTGMLRIIYTHRTFFETYDVTWAANDAWTWTSVEAMLAVICASAPALKVFFKEYLKVSSFGSGLQYAFRRTGYTRNGYAETKGVDTVRTGASTSVIHSVTNHFKTQGDVEMGGIAVTKEIDVNSEDSPPASTYEQPSSGRRTPSMGIHHTGRMSNSDVPWLHIEPPEQNNIPFEEAAGRKNRRR